MLKTFSDARFARKIRNKNVLGFQEYREWLVWLYLPLVQQCKCQLLFEARFKSLPIIMASVFIEQEPKLVGTTSIFAVSGSFCEFKPFKWYCLPANERK